MLLRCYSTSCLALFCGSYIKLKHVVNFYFHVIDSKSESCLCKKYKCRNVTKVFKYSKATNIFSKNTKHINRKTILNFRDFLLISYSQNRDHVEILGNNKFLNKLVNPIFSAALATTRKFKIWETIIRADSLHLCDFENAAHALQT